MEVDIYLQHTSSMLTDKKYRKLDFILVDEKDIGPILFRLYENRVFHAIIKEGEKVTMEMVTEGYKFLDENGGGLFYNIYEFKSFSDVEPEVRNWSAKELEKSYTFVDAIVISNIAQKILADFYLKFNKPAQPTKIFNSTEKAIDWIKLKMNENL
ncbi:MAG: hypothetical protein HYR91_07785 [Flavobacteriia bacterium]|nr:hypothetical protein [Flavobacteriia bacterium]